MSHVHLILHEFRHKNWQQLVRLCFGFFNFLFRKELVSCLLFRFVGQIEGIEGDEDKENHEAYNRVEFYQILAWFITDVLPGGVVVVEYCNADDKIDKIDTVREIEEQGGENSDVEVECSNNWSNCRGERDFKIFSDPVVPKFCKYCKEEHNESVITLSVFKWAREYPKYENDKPARQSNSYEKIDIFWLTKTLCNLRIIICLRNDIIADCEDNQDW